MSGCRTLTARKLLGFGFLATWWFFGSARCPAQAPYAPKEVSLTLKQAVELAFAASGNAAIQLSRLETKMAAAQSREALSALLPTLYGSANVTDFIESFSAQGFTQIKLPFGLTLPPTIGPLDEFDIRATVAGNIFDFGAIRRFESARAGTRASKSEVESAMESIASAVARQYMAVLREAAEVEAAGATVNLANSLVEQSQRLRDAGNAVGLDVTRAQVELAEEQLRLQGASSSLKEAQLNLLRTLRLDLDTPLHLADKLDYVPANPLTLAAAGAEAKKLRPDLRAETERQTAARLNLSASRMQHLPTLAGFANYGTTGNANESALPTYAMGVSVRVPVFDGGRMEARVAESLTQYREQSVRVRDMSDQIDLEIRLALERLTTAELQFKTAEAGLALAQTEVDQATRRYSEGVAGSIEVTDAQTKLARAQNSRIAALFNHNVARIDLNYAMGSLVRMIGE